MRKNIDFSKGIRGKHTNTKLKVVGADKPEKGKAEEIEIDGKLFDSIQQADPTDYTEDDAVEIVRHARRSRNLKRKEKFIQTENITNLRKLAENYWNSRATEDDESTEIGKILRESLKCEFISWNYQKDVDLLFIRFAPEKSVISSGDMANGIIYDYDAKDNLVSIEILDFYGVFAINDE